MPVCSDKGHVISSKVVKNLLKEKECSRHYQMFTLIYKNRVLNLGTEFDRVWLRLWTSNTIFLMGGIIRQELKKQGSS